MSSNSSKSAHPHVNFLSEPAPLQIFAKLRNLVLLSTLTLVVASCGWVTKHRIELGPLAKTSISQQRFYSAFYYDSNNKLIRVENLLGKPRSAIGRNVQPATPGGVPRIGESDDAACTTPKMGIQGATFAVYYGLWHKATPANGTQREPAELLGWEDVTSDQEREVFCKIKPDPSCSFPKMCHCSGFGSCCCW